MLQIVSFVFISFLSAFDATSMLLSRSLFCKSAPLISRRFENLILFVKFCVVFGYNLAVRPGLLLLEDIYLYVTTFSVFLFS